MTNVALIQQRATADVDANLKRSCQLIREAAAQGNELVVLQELHRSLYFCQSEDTANFKLAETIPGPTSQLLGELAQELNIVIVASLFEERMPGLYHNSAVVLERDGSIAGIYRKMHIPDDPGFYEKFYFTPGDLGFTPIQTSVGCLGVLICWDQWFPEAARLMALAGAEILIYPTAIGWDPRDDKTEQQRQLNAWQISQQAHAVANGISVISCNRVGFEAAPNGGAGIEFWGNSFICGPQGEILSQANSDDEIILSSKLDREGSHAVRQIWPFLRDRRVDSYEEILLLSSK